MSRDYPKKQNQSTWDVGIRTQPVASGGSRTGYVKGLTQVREDTQPLASPVIENQPRKYTKADNPLMATPTKQSLIPAFAKGGRVDKAVQMNGAPMTPPAGEKAQGGPAFGAAMAPPGAAVSQVHKGPKGQEGARRQAVPMTRDLNPGDKPEAPGMPDGGFSGSLGGMPLDGFGSGQYAEDGMNSGYDMSGMKDWQDFGQGLRNQISGAGSPPGTGMWGSGTSPGMIGGGFSTGGGFGSDAGGGYKESGPSYGADQPGGSWGGESHFAKGGKATKPAGNKSVGSFSKDSSGSTDSMGGGGGMTPPTPSTDFFGDSTLPGGYGGQMTNGGATTGGVMGFGPNGVPAGLPANRFNAVGDLYDYGGNARPQSAPSMGAGTATVTRGPGAGQTAAVAPGYSRPAPSPSVGSAGGGAMGAGAGNQMDYGNFNNSGYGNYDFGLNPNMAGRTFDDNYGGNNPNSGSGVSSPSGGGSTGNGGFDAAGEQR